MWTTWTFRPRDGNRRAAQSPAIEASKAAFHRNVMPRHRKPVPGEIGQCSTRRGRIGIGKRKINLSKLHQHLRHPPVLVDWWAGLGELANVPLPAAVLFYPAIALLAETVFHILPLAFGIWLLGIVGRQVASASPIWPLLILVALIEPAYQVTAQLGAEGWSLVAGFVAVHVYLFNLAQLWVFVRCGFFAMYAFRLVYYLWWHIAWGPCDWNCNRRGDYG